MVRNLRWLAIIRWVTLALAFPGMGSGQEQAEFQVPPSEVVEAPTPPPGAASGAMEFDEGGAVESQQNDELEALRAEEAAERDRVVREQFSSLEERIVTLAPQFIALQGKTFYQERP